MALKGSLQEFAPPDVIQLIGRQNHQGTALFRARDDQVALVFRAGAVVRVEDRLHPFDRWLPGALVSGGVVRAADVEKLRTAAGKNAGQLATLLVGRGLVRKDMVRSLHQLWTSETAFRVFMFKEGHYEFTTHDVADDPRGMDWNVRWDTLVMEGLKRAHEWRDIFDVIPHNQVKFEVERPLPPPVENQESAEDAAFLGNAFEEDSIMGDIDGAAHTTVFQAAFTASERKMHALVRPGITAQQLVDASLLGKYETMRALSTLVRAGYLRMDGLTLDVELGI